LILIIPALCGLVATLPPAGFVFPARAKGRGLQGAAGEEALLHGQILQGFLLLVTLANMFLQLQIPLPAVRRLSTICKLAIREICGLAIACLPIGFFRGQGDCKLVAQETLLTLQETCK